MRVTTRHRPGGGPGPGEGRGRASALRRVRPLPPAGGLALVAALILGGCGLETPEAPSFETTLNIPIEEETYTGQQMAEGLQAVAGDTTAPGPLAIQFTEEIDPLRLEGEIRVGIDARDYTADLTAIEFTPPDLPPVALALGQVAADSLMPPGGTGPIPAFSFAPPAVDLGEIDAFHEVAFVAGRLDVTIRNDLPVPVGGGQPEQALRVRLLDRSSTPATLALEWAIAQEIAPGQSARCSGDLAGVTLSNALAVEVSGWSAGSRGASVVPGTAAALSVEFGFGSTEVGRLAGRLPALHAQTEGRIDFSEDCAIREAAVSAGHLTCRLENRWPVAATLILEAPQILTGGEPLHIAAQVGALGAASVEIDLTGAEMNRGAAADWGLRLTAITESPGETAEVALGPATRATLAAGELRLASIRGILDHVAVDLTPIETAIEYPAGTEGVEILAAEAEILVRSRVGMAAEAQLELRAAAGGDTVRVPVSVALAAGSPGTPAATRVTLDEGNSAIAELLRLRPTAVALSGVIAVGDGASEGVVRAGDYVDGQLTLRAPMRLVLETAHQQGDPFAIELDEELRERVAGNLLGVSVEAEVENHFPTAVALEFHFAREEGALFVTDDLILTSAPIASAQVDPTTGRVSASTTAVATLTVAEGEIDLFTEGRLHGALAVTLLGDGERPIEIWSTDYVRVKGVAAFRCRVD